MALRDRMRENVQGLLQPGEQVRAVFRAQSGLSPWLGALTWLFFFAMKYFLIVRTDRRLLVVRSGMWTQSGAKEIVAEHPAETRIEGPTGSVWGKVTIAGTRYWVHRRFFDDVKAANSTS